MDKTISDYIETNYQKEGENVMSTVPVTPAPTSNTNPVVADVEKVINIGEVWITKASQWLAKEIGKEKPLSPQVATAVAGTYQAVEQFLASATPAVAGEGLNFPADSVAYANFVALVAQFQKDASVIKQVIGAL